MSINNLEGMNKRELLVVIGIQQESFLESLTREKTLEIVAEEWKSRCLDYKNKLEARDKLESLDKRIDKLFEERI